jgi:hypothetical protein
MKRHPVHVVIAKLKRGESLRCRDYGLYEFDDGSRPGQGVMSFLQNADRVTEVCDNGTKIGARVVLKA